MWIRHLDYASDTPVTELGAAAIDALLERGDLESWAPLLQAVADDPWGLTADTILGLCDAHPMYGTSALWQTWIERRRGGSGLEGTTLAEARGRAGLTQSDVAERLGISQSDVSKLERRSDLRVSTLQAYVLAIGARLHIEIQGPDEGPRREVVLSGGDMRRSTRYRRPHRRDQTLQ